MPIKFLNQMPWKIAKTQWLNFLEEVEDTQLALRCSYSNAWFRGIINTVYELKPNLFRVDNKNDPDYKVEIEYLIQEKEKISEKCKLLVKEKTNHKNFNNEIYKDKNKLDETDYKLKLEENKLNKQRVVNEISDCRQQIKEIDNRLKDLNLVYTGEREAFVEYKFRSGRDCGSSWEVLAEMQHYGVPTRLLDWSENLSVAIHFALFKYFKELNEYWENNRTEPFSFYNPNIPEKPALWVLNPYQASEEATERKRIWDFTLEKDYDYFENFVVKRSWHFHKPVPMYSPWKNPRLAAQQGMFTVFGYNQEPLENQFSKNVVRKIEISHLAAIYGVKHLRQLFGLDHFLLFRDLDTLARKVKLEFLHRE